MKKSTKSIIQFIIITLIALAGALLGLVLLNAVPALWAAGSQFWAIGAVFMGLNLLKNSFGVAIEADQLYRHEQKILRQKVCTVLS